MPSAYQHHRQRRISGPTTDRLFGQKYKGWNVILPLITRTVHRDRETLYFLLNIVSPWKCLRPLGCTKRLCLAGYPLLLCTHLTRLNKRRMRCIKVKFSKNKSDIFYADLFLGSFQLYSLTAAIVGQSSVFRWLFVAPIPVDARDSLYYCLLLDPPESQVPSFPAYNIDRRCWNLH